jgi:hypothetical protein
MRRPEWGEWSTCAIWPKVLAHVHSAEIEIEICSGYHHAAGRCSEQRLKRAKPSADRAALRMRMRDHGARCNPGVQCNTLASPRALNTFPIATGPVLSLMPFESHLKKLVLPRKAGASITVTCAWV